MDVQQPFIISLCWLFTEESFDEEGALKKRTLQEGT